MPHTLANQQAPKPANASRTHIKALRAFLGTAITLAALVVIDAFLTYAMVPTGGMTEKIWARYALSSDTPIDTLVVGTSFSMTIDPSAVDESLGSHTFTLATPSQSREASLVAIQDAYEEHHISRVIMATAIGNMNNFDRDLEYDVAFYLNEARGRGLLHFGEKYLESVRGSWYLGNANSLAALAPWTVFNVGWSPTAIAQNLETKAESTTESMANDGDFVPNAQGYIAQDGAYDLSAASPNATAADADEYVLDERVMDEYRAIADYCSDHDIDLYLVVTPRPAFSLLRFENEGGYAVAISQFENALSDKDLTFIDFSMTRPNYYRAELSEFRDVGHLNVAGSQRFSKMLGDMISRIEKGESTESLFYPHTQAGWSEYCASVDELAMATYYPTVRDDSIDIVCDSWTGTGPTVQYEVSRATESGDYEVLRPFDESADYTYPTQGHGTVTLRVTSRLVTDEADATDGAAQELVCERTILY